MFGTWAWWIRDEFVLGGAVTSEVDKLSAPMNVRDKKRIASTTPRVSWGQLEFIPTTQAQVMA